MNHPSLKCIQVQHINTYTLQKGLIHECYPNYHTHCLGCGKEKNY